MQTSYFARWRGRQDPRLVSISRYAPAGYRGRRYLALAPRPDMLKMEPEEFWPAYEAILNNLDPRQVWEDLGDDAILLCWEGPGKPCHRRRVAAWFEEHLGVNVPEVTESAAPSVTLKRKWLGVESF